MILRKSAFTLTELLVVIAIISVLAALLLPSLDNAIELSRRTVCASNERQIYLAAGCYASDADDRLPYRISTGFIYDSYTFSYYASPLSEPVRRFLDIYLNLPTGQYLAFPNTNNVMYCPSMKTPHTAAMDTDWPNRAAYSFRAFGMFSNGMCQGMRVGTTRFSVVGTPGPLGGKAFLLEHTWLPGGAYAPTDGYNGNNHAWQGSNALVGDGSARWVDIADHAGSGNSCYPKMYYTQTYELYTPMPIATVATQGVAAYPPNGTTYGWNHQPEYWNPNRKLFGYAR